MNCKSIEWLKYAIKNNLVCGEYVNRITRAETKRDLFRILCDPNGVSFIQELQNNGTKVPIDDFANDFSTLINGNAVIYYDKGYSSKMYVNFNEELIADTTLISLINCKCGVVIPKNKWPRIVLNRDCQATILLNEGSRLLLEVYGDAKFSITGDQTRVTVHYK